MEVRDLELQESDSGVVVVRLSPSSARALMAVAMTNVSVPRVVEEYREVDADDVVGLLRDVAEQLRVQRAKH